MTVVRKAGWKTFLVLVLLIGVAGLQIAGSFASHDHGRAQCCIVCQAGHLPALQACVASVDLPGISEWRQELSQTAAPRDCPVAFYLSRAPPA
jgi:hypothetical protein